MLGLGSSLTKGAALVARYIRDGLKLYMPYRGGNHDEVQFVGTGSTSFDGTNDSIDCGDDSTLKITGNITLSAWIKTSEDDHTIMGKWDNDDGDGYMLYVLSGGTVIFRTNNGYRPSTTSVNDGVWHHIAGTWDGTNGYVYIDGIREDGSVSGTLANPLTNSIQLSIGAFHSTPRDFFEGNIKNAAIWSRALTATEVQNVMYKTYDEVGGRLVSGLVSWWALDAISSLGSELWDADASVFTSGTYSWNVEGNNTIANVGNALAITYVDSASGARVDFSDAEDLSTNLTVTKVYQLTFDASYSGGSSGVRLRVYDNSAYNYSDIFTTSTASYSVSFEAGHATGCYILLEFLGSGQVVTLDNLSLKEVQAKDLKGSNDGTIIGATIDEDLYGGDTPIKPRAIDNAPTVQADAIGAGSAFFDQDNADYITMGDVAAFSDADGFSIAFWVKFVEITGDSALVTKHADYGDVDNAGEFFIINDDGICEFVVVDHTNSASIGTYTGTVFVAGNWYHVACTHDGGTASSGCLIYIDGVLQTHNANATGSGFANINDTAQEFRIGAFTDDGEPHDGNICQAGFWSAALTQAQIQSVMEKTYNELTASEKTDLVSYWPLDVDADASDSHGSNDGTLV